MEQQTCAEKVKAERWKVEERTAENTRHCLEAAAVFENANRAAQERHRRGSCRETMTCW